MSSEKTYQALQIPDIARRLENLIRIGTIAELDTANGLARVQSGDLLTNWLAWLPARAGPDKTWWAPEVGEQVVMLSPSGNLSQALILSAIYSEANPAPDNSADRHVIEYQNGTKITHDRAAGLHITEYPDGTVIKHDIAASATEINSAGTVTVISAAAMSLQCGGNLTIQASGTTLIDSGGAMTLKAPSIAMVQ